MSRLPSDRGGVDDARRRDSRKNRAPGSGERRLPYVGGLWSPALRPASGFLATATCESQAEPAGRPHFGRGLVAAGQYGRGLLGTARGVLAETSETWRTGPAALFSRRGP